MKSLETIAALLSKQVGFAPKLIGDRKLARAVQTRRLACNLPDEEAYLKLLQSSPQELDELIEQLVVPETWFFRDRKPFDFLVRFVRSEWLMKPGIPKLRVLSVPCSTGEEPYSIAIALIEAGLPLNRFSIDAVDISQNAIAKAQRAIYGKNSFRGEEWVQRDRYFQPIGDKYTVSPIVRSAVNFRQGNVLHELSLVQPQYHIIFCRNLLIYLEDSACRQVFNTLHGLLTPEGLLFVGAAETGKVLSDRFCYLGQSFTFAYRKVDPLSSSTVRSQPVSLSSNAERSERSKVKTTEKQPSTAVSVPKPQANVSPGRQPSPQTVEPPKPVLFSPTLDFSLQQAKQLADVGQFLDAIHCCKTYLESYPTSAEAYLLLGTLYQAKRSDEQAERCFQKALYLQPNCYEALMQLALIKESRGEAIAADRLRRRIQKLQLTS